MHLSRNAHSTQRSLRRPSLQVTVVLLFSLLVGESLAHAQDPATVPASREQELQTQVRAVVEQQRIVHDKRQESAERKTQLESALKTFRSEGFDKDPPYSLALLDGLRDEQAAEQSRVDAMEAAVASVEEALDTARNLSEEKQSARRLAKEKADASPTVELQAALALAEVESRLADETLKLRQTELETQKLALEIQQTLLTTLQEKIAVASEACQFAKSELQARLAEIGQIETEVKRMIEAAELNHKYNEERWADARRRFDSATEDRAVLSEEVEAWRLARQKRHEQLAVLNKRVQRLTDMRTVWNRRYGLMSGEPTADELATWEAETADALEQIQRDRLLRTSQVDQARKDLATIEKKIEDAKEGPPELSRWLSEQRKHVQELIKVYDDPILSIESGQRLYQKLHEELRQDAETVSLSEWLAAAKRHLSGIWNYELTAVDDRPITVGKIVLGIVLFVLGILIARFLSRLLELRLRRRARVSKDAATAFRTLMFYTLVVIFALFALSLANVPLTTFAVIGGALAIGVGLGSQGLVNNFLSGLVIMVERPVRLGERVVYGGHDGIVEEIGFRGTRVRTLTGHLVTIPNSSIINETVENIGRRRYIRRLFNITITYDTPKEKIREATELVRAILSEDGIREPIHPTIAGDEYPPRAYFNEFNSDSLNIIVIYWFAPPDFWGFFEHSEKVNLRIVEEFEKAGIDFAFPTQTLHLAGDPKRELAMRLLGNESNMPGSKGP